MTQKQIYIILGIIILVILSILIINIANKEDNKSYVSNVNKEVDLIVIANEKKKIEEEIKNAVAECKKMYEQYGKEHFEIYYGIEFINNYMSENEIEFETSNLKDLSLIKIYDNEGNRLEEIPVIENISKEYQIKPNQRYLIKVYGNEYTYYYTMQIGQTGFVSLEQLYFTEGEYQEHIGYIEIE